MGLFTRRTPTARPVEREADLVPLMFPVVVDDPVTVELPAESSPISRTVVDDQMIVLYGIDQPERYEIVLAGQAADFGGLDAIHDRALDTLRRRVEQELVVDGGDGRYRVYLNGPSRDLTASLVLLPDLLRARMPLGNTFVVALGNRVWLHIIDDPTPDELRALRELNVSIYESGQAKPISHELFRVDPEGSLRLLGVPD